MILFLYSLNGDVQKWYWSLSTASISSLQDFHAAFLRYCRRFYPSEVLLEGCCDKFKSHIHPTSDLATRKKSSDAFGERDSKMEKVCYNVKIEQSPCLSDSREEGFPDYTDDIVPSYVSRDPLGPLLNMTIAPDLRDESFAAEDHSNSLSDLSHDVFSLVGTKKHAQIACLLVQITRDLGSTFFDDGPDDVEQPSTFFLEGIQNDQPVYDRYESEYEADSCELAASLLSDVSESTAPEYIEHMTHPLLIVPRFPDLINGHWAEIIEEPQKQLHTPSPLVAAQPTFLNTQ